MNHILLYSKYSKSCLSILDTVNELNSFLTINLVCIDNKEIRKRICGSKSFEITKVPCLLILNDGTVEKYEGEKVFLWVNQVADNFKNSQSQSQKSQPQQSQQQQQQPQPQQSQPQQSQPQQPQQPQQSQPQQPQQPQQSQPKSRNKKSQSRIEINDDEEEDNEADEKYVPQSLMNVHKTRTKKVSKINMTRIEDLDEKEEEDDVQDTKIKRPPIPIRNGAGNYSFEDELEIEPSTSNYVTPKKIKKLKKAGTSDTGSVLDMAMLMRQEREKENKERDNNK